MKILSKPAKHAKSSFHDREAISLLENILTSHKLIMPDLKKDDTWPNTDGYLEVTEGNGYPVGKLEAQVKSLNEKRIKRRISYRFNDEKFLAYCYNNSKPRELSILFIGVDRQNKKAYWREITPEDIAKLKNKTIYLPKGNVIDYDNTSYHRSWLKICKTRQKILKEGLKEWKKGAYEKGVVVKIKKKKVLSKVEEIRDKFQQALISRELKIKYYYGFINFLEPFYRDKRGEIKREKLRKLFKITKKDENCFIDELKKNNLIEVTCDLVTVKDRDKAKENLNELIEKPVISVDKIINLFSD